MHFPILQSNACQHLSKARRETSYETREDPPSIKTPAEFETPTQSHIYIYTHIVACACIYIYICIYTCLTEVLGERRLKLLGHVLRRDRQHPLHQAAFKTQSAVPRETEQRTVGRPRQFWTTANMEKAWNILTSKDVSVPKVPFKKHDREIRETIIDHARRYQPPFH